MFDVFVMDMGGHDENVQQILSKLPHAQTMRYMTCHLEMVKRAASKSKTEMFWLIASCGSYADFNFDYLPCPWEQEQIHCWARGNQKFGDTFLINVSAWEKQQYVEKLEWYKDINWHADGVRRLAWPKTEVENDLVSKIRTHNFKRLYENFYIKGSNSSFDFDPNLWEIRDVVSYNNGHTILCPRDIKSFLNNQIYDYPNILKIKDNESIKLSNDIVFISYDEENADKNWEKLILKFPRAHRIHGVPNMLAALKQAANTVITPYFYAVFAKTNINEEFDFNYNPDYLKEKSNYVFRAYNPVLDCSYGHGGIVLYNTEWLRNVESYEGDLTMSLPVVSVPVDSCVNNYDETPWSAWRTAFREVYKLHNKLDKSIEDQYHLHLWLTCDRGVNGKWSKLGALHATKVAIDSKKLNDWEWLKEEFNQCYEQNQ